MRTKACRARGVRFLVLLHPDRPTMAGEERMIAPFEEGRPELAGVRIVDLRRRYEQAGLAFDDFATDKIGHLGPRGHAFIAAVLREELASGPDGPPR